MKKYAEDLAKDYELGNNKEDFFEYILESLINGQRQQMKALFNMMKGEDQKEFLVDFLQDDGGIQKSCKNILISELIG